MERSENGQYQLIMVEVIGRIGRIGAEDREGYIAFKYLNRITL